MNKWWMNIEISILHTAQPNIVMWRKNTLFNFFFIICYVNCFHYDFRPKLGDTGIRPELPSLYSVERVWIHVITETKHGLGVN